MDLLLVFLVVALILWIVFQYAPGAPKWVADCAFLAWAIAATALLCGLHLEV